MPDRNEDLSKVDANVEDSTEALFEPATMLVTAYQAAGLEKQWEQSLGELLTASFSFPGHLGTTVLKPKVSANREYRVITKFDSIENMEGYRDSEERLWRVERIRRFQSRPADIHYVTGLETWFDLPHQGEMMLLEHCPPLG